LKGTIPISEDTAPGVLPNIIAGRIANVYDFHGPSFTVDAACASVLAAVITGIQGLALKVTMR
jgi:acyl transferase domain-containing protein